MRDSVIFFLLSDKRLRAAFTTVFGMYDDILFEAVAAILWPWGNTHKCKVKDDETE